MDDRESEETSDALGIKPSKVVITVAEAATEGGQRFFEAMKYAEMPWQVREFNEPLTESNASWVDAATQILSVFVDSRVDREVLSQLPNLQMIATRSTGYDHIDLEACHERGIVVANVPLYGANTVAEHTFALILSLSRNVHRAWVRTQRQDFGVVGLQGFDLRGRTLGVVGTGNIGMHVIKIARGFGMRVLASDPQPNELAAEVLGFAYAPLESVLQQADIVTLHAPLVPATERLINAETIASMKRGALLINTSRGGLVDTQALLRALNTGQLGGAGLDVLEGEELLSEDHWDVVSSANESELRRMLEHQQLLLREDVVVTPHIAFDSVEAVQRIADTTLQNVQRYLDGVPENVVV